MNRLIDLLSHSGQFGDLLRRLDLESAAGGVPARVTGVHGAAHACVLAALRRTMPGDSVLLSVFPTQSEARQTHQDLIALEAERVGVFPLLPDLLGDSPVDSRKSLRSERLQALEIVRNGGQIVTSVHALCQRLPDVDAALDTVLHLSVGETHDLADIGLSLAKAGYRRVDTVELKGEYSVRGGIIDVFPLTRDRPIRIEFFGDEIESIRHFDESTQRSTKALDAVRIAPTREYVLSDEARREWLINAHARYGELPSQKLRAQIEALTEELFETGTVADVELYYPFLFPNGSTLPDALPKGSLVYVSEPTWLRREYVRFLEKIESLSDQAKADDRLWVNPSEAFEMYEKVEEALRRLPIVEAAFGVSSEESGPEPISFDAVALAEYQGNLQRFLKGLGRWHEEGYAVWVFSESENARAQLVDILRDHRLTDADITVEVGWISEGFQSDVLRLVVVPQEAVFGRARRGPQRKSRFRDGRPLLSLVDISEGDFIVHVSHGVGQYEGIKRLSVGRDEHDFFAIRYAGSDVLYVPTYHLNMIQKYIGGTGDKPIAMDKLGGTSWNRAKARVKKSVEDLADELLELYAAREATPGRKFAPDVPWQREFDAAFPFEETPDQMKAIEEVKGDMERARPMDRLICGDVGYGKTEVVIRAAFKAVMDGAQVCVLVPTTVLAQQHYLTFRERFREYPIDVRVLSRLVPAAEAKRTIELMAAGTVDVVIGTHRLLSRDLKFRDLGLLVVDEEHRFGVKQKERLRQLKKQVDTVTLTATPIPRTLHMAMTGVRDMTVIDTPPENRLPIETCVMEYRPDVVRDAILRELARDGQAFFVHNRVHGIESIAENLRQLVPTARVIVAHGQMAERRLEDVMLRFVRHEFDVLVCTTIIESGLDIPNVNTILINRADALGLAQLYQLRGRVGRSDRRAYGYLFYPDDRVITEASQKRLRVIEEFTELGSGFRIALHDLEIRGAGNLLGPEQHGHIASIGYDLYCKLLETAIAERKGEPVQEEVETRVKLPVSAFLPDEYVANGAAKMALYKRLSNIRGRDERDEVEAEMRDRYGPLPDPAQHLLDVALVKGIATGLGVESIAVSDGRLQLVFDEGRANVETESILKLIEKNPKVQLVPPASLALTLAGREPRLFFDSVFELLEDLS